MKKAAKKSVPAQDVGKFVGTEPVMRPLASYTPNEWNPNRMSADERKKFRHTLQRFGWLRSQAMLVWASDEKGKRQNIIVDGQHRWEEARRLGFTHGPVVELHKITRAEAVAWTIRVDKIRGSFDDHKLAKVLDDEFGIFAGREELGDLGLDLGFARDEIDDLRLKLPEVAGAGASVIDESNPEDDEVPEPPKVVVTKPGDVWQLGQHRIVCGDSFLDSTRVKGFKPETVDLVVTDPPFAIYGSSTGLGADMSDDQMVRPFFSQLFTVIRGSVRDFAHCYVCCDWRSYPSVWDGQARGKMSPKNLIVWDKAGGGLGSSYANAYELISFSARLPPPTAMKGTKSAGGLHGGRQRTVLASNIFRFNRASGEERLHNAAKPTDLLRRVISLSSDKNELVADFFGGSCSVLIASEREERRSVTFEIEPRWCDVGVERWEKATGGKAKRVNA